MLNNPIRFNDPTGHSVDCGLGDPFCNGGEYKPGGLISLYRQNFGKDALDRPNNSPKPVRDRLSQEIESYLIENPDYNFREDNLLEGSSNNYGLFSSIRLDYWRNRCMESCNGGDLLTEPEKLYRYYDLHENIQISMFDPSRIDWISAGLDTSSLVLSVVGLNVASNSAKVALTTNYASKGLGAGLGAGSGAYSYEIGDITGTYLSVGGFLPAPFGTLASGASVVRDFSAGFYYVPYVPPITR
ncbi:MAG: hypothetical protein Q7T89_07945 [Anaerolineales bacterium]|nr:hypothetical protein [Anaerolineales bacterium]